MSNSAKRHSSDVCVLITLPHAGPPFERTQEPPQEPTSVWLYSLYKTITYETAANLADIPLYSTVLVGAQAGTGLFTNSKCYNGFRCVLRLRCGLEYLRSGHGRDPRSRDKNGN